MFKDNKGIIVINTTVYRIEAIRYLKSIHIIFNKKVYVNRENFKQ